VRGGRLSKRLAPFSTLDSWLQGQGAAGIRNLLEDAATAKISRAQLWKWPHRHAKPNDRRPVTEELHKEMRDQKLQALGALSGLVPLAKPLRLLYKSLINLHDIDG
jgi:malate synthase